MFGTETYWIARKRKSEMGTEAECQETKIMPVTKKQAHIRKSRITAMIAVEVVQSFVCLGSEIGANGSCDTEMRWRMVLAGSVMNRLSKSIFRWHDVSLDLKLRLTANKWEYSLGPIHCHAQSRIGFFPQENIRASQWPVIALEIPKIFHHQNWRTTCNGGLVRKIHIRVISHPAMIKKCSWGND